MIKKSKIFKIYYLSKLQPIQENQELYDNKQIDEDLKFINNTEDESPLNIIKNSSTNDENDEYSFYDCCKILCCFTLFKI